MSSSSIRIEGTVTVGCPPPSREKWKSFMFHFHDFSNLRTTRKHFIASPKFICNGHRWQLKVYPGGNHAAEGEGNVSAFLHHLSEEAIAIRYEIKVIDKFGKTTKRTTSSKKNFSAANNSWGRPNFIDRSVILDESENILDDNGTLTVIVSVGEEQAPVFVPKNPFINMMQGKFNDEATADVFFEVNNVGEKKDDDGKKRVKTTTPFYAHRLILEACAPMLAAICGSNDSGGVVTASVNDIKPDIFHHLLSYIYGMTIPEEELKTHAKDIIDAADKYSVVNLKLAAEAAYVQSADISLDNAMDNLLYADSRNCALLKEAVVNFLAENDCEAAANISFADFPGHVVKDLLIAFSRNRKKDGNGTNVDKLTTLSVSELRRKLDEKGLEVDGSREAMIESIKSNS
ncbi:hypothetical protein ACHAWT_005044 [Skeletonema menzelii]